MEGLTPQRLPPSLMDPCPEPGLQQAAPPTRWHWMPHSPQVSSFTFPKGTGIVPRASTIAAPDDTDFIDAAIPLSHGSSGAGYGALPP